MNTDTIVAVATPPGKGGVAIIRLSGVKAFEIAKKLSKRSSISPREIQLCNIYDRQDDYLDSGILLYFVSPHSFTGENVIELQMHGSPVIINAIVQECVHYGARIAMPGEYSQRAFLNNKLDLTQAEAIADLIEADSLKAAQMAGRSLQGAFSRYVNDINASLINLRLYVEASIDFPDEDIDVLENGVITQRLQSIIETVQGMQAQASQGVLMREGLTIVIAGRPNAGKSTLINALAKQDIAIVTEVAGTTRDVMRAHVLLDDIPVHILDTAGLHDSSDLVEKEGIKRAWQAIESADCVLHLVDAAQKEDNQSLNAELQKALAPKTPIITVWNKIDLSTAKIPPDSNTLCISAKTQKGMEDLISTIKKIGGYQPVEGQFLARQRHLDAINRALDCLLNGQKQLLHHHALELLADDLRHAHEELGAITGEFSADDLLGEIFSNFCIGK